MDGDNAVAMMFRAPAFCCDEFQVEQRIDFYNVWGSGRLRTTMVVWAADLPRVKSYK